MEDLKNKPDSYWKEKLTPLQYQVCRLKEREPIWTDNLFPGYVQGVYSCVACEHPLFSSDAKIDTSAGQGWPGFDAPINREDVELHEVLFYERKLVEVACNNCGSHLGHLFPDDESEITGMRYCINSVALKFEPTALWGW
jgi:peptide-methionine (R)-S-oxide reductase